jgi:Protein of unknown function with HXXEE motif
MDGLTAKEVLVRNRLGVVMGLLEAASVSLLFLLLKQAVLPDKTGVLLVFLFPIAFGLHVIEEFILPGGFIRWDNTFRPEYTDTPASFYIKVNALPGAAALLSGLGSFDYAGGYGVPGLRSWLAFLTFMTMNTWFHVRGAIVTRHYSPGMVTGLVLFVPLTIASYLHFVRAGALGAASVVACIAAALTIQPALDWIKRGIRKQKGHR